MWKTLLVHRATGVAKSSITQSCGMPKGVGSISPNSHRHRRVEDDRDRQHQADPEAAAHVRFHRRRHARVGHVVAAVRPWPLCPIAAWSIGSVVAAVCARCACAWEETSPLGSGTGLRSPQQQVTRSASSSALTIPSWAWTWAT